MSCNVVFVVEAWLKEAILGSKCFLVLSFLLETVSILMYCNYKNFYP